MLCIGGLLRSGSDGTGQVGHNNGLHRHVRLSDVPKFTASEQKDGLSCSRCVCVCV